MERILTPILLLAVAFGSPSAPQEGKKLNIVLILADDLGYECLGSYGGTSYKTPILDALAKSGIRFENCFCTPLCSPSRAELMTGRYGFRTGWTQLIEAAGDEYFDPRKEKTFGHVLKSAGYVTGIAGKWQLCHFQKHPNHLQECGFDEYCMWTWQWDGRRTSRYWNPSMWQDGKLRAGVEDRYGPDLSCEFGVDFIKRHKDQPFFLYYPIELVHAPFEPTPDGKEAKKSGKAAEKNFPDMVAYMDKLVGRIVATLDQLKLRENTLVLFTGDNGTTRGIPSKVGDRTVVGGKGTMKDTGSRVPLIANWPGTVPAGKTLDDLVDFTDVLPTLCELTGARLPGGVTIDGRSFAPQLKGQPGKPREWVFVQLGKKRFVRDPRWKLHEHGELYDIKADPDETKPLSPVSEPPEAAAARKRLEEALMKLK